MSSDTLQPALTALQAAVGPAHLLTGDGLQRYERDWRGRLQGRALAVARPASTAEVATVVGICAQHGIPVVPQGGNTGLNGGATPDASGRQLVLSLQRLQRIRDLDPVNLSMTVEAGCVLESLQSAARAADCLLALNLAAKGSCTIGGNLATNAGGTEVLHYGNARAQCLGLEVVTADGRIWHGLSGLRKDNTGYDLRDLFIGSEGTLGVITAATLKLHPLPASQTVAWVALPSLPAAVHLLTQARQALGPALTGFEAMHTGALELVHQHFPEQRIPLLGAAPWHVLLEHSGHQGAEHAAQQLQGWLAASLEHGAAIDAVLADSLDQARRMWRVRESITLAQAREGASLKHDVSLPISRIAAFVQEADAALAQAFPAMRRINFGHLGDGNLHYNVQAPAGAEGARQLQRAESRISALVYDGVARHGGSISAEHGIGSAKVALLPRHKPAQALALMHAIKRALDPAGIMNPGKVLMPENRRQPPQDGAA